MQEFGFKHVACRGEETVTPNPYQSPRTESSVQVRQAKSPYLVLNVVLILVIAAFCLLPLFTITAISTSSNGTVVTSQTTLTGVQWNPMGLLVILSFFFLANAVLFVFRSLILRKKSS